jgi:hypothetical protein
MFQALLAHPHEALNKRRLVYYVRVIVSWLQPTNETLIVAYLYRNFLSLFCPNSHYYCHKCLQLDSHRKTYHRDRCTAENIVLALTILHNLYVAYNMEYRPLYPVLSKMIQVYFTLFFPSASAVFTVFHSRS